ncbi:RNA methyltransferase [Pigmentiphaga soli]|uniref:RNA methyltransferase n=1 Tax=Pigmentiphaga soli TaxID=1007095 RepID=A0ABP8H5V7_9BURK
MLSRVSFVMVEPSHPGNVGSAARALKTMGFSRLVLVAPRDPAVSGHPDAVALASGAADVLAAAVLRETLQEALAPSTLALALTARSRDLGPPSCDMREAAALARDHLFSHAQAGVAGEQPHGGGPQVAVVLGTERSGLTNEHIALCHRICHIPANPAYSSLNVAQALQLAAYELRYALLGPAGHENVRSPGPQGAARDAAAVAGAAGAPLRGEPASGEAVAGLLAHWEQALTAVGFLDPQHPKKLMPRMRHLFARAQLSREETDLLRGVCTAMIATAGRRGAGNASSGDDATGSDENNKNKHDDGRT